VVERALEVADAELANVDRRIPVERNVVQRQILVVGTLNRVEHERTVFDAAAHGADFVEAPGEGHETGAAYAAVRGAQTGDAADSRGLNDRPAGFGADGKAD